MAKSTWAKRCVMAVCFVLVAGLTVSGASADEHGGKRRRGSHKEDRSGAYPMPPVYKESCGSCHMAYGASLLPEASWRGMLDAPGAHFGTAISLDADTKRQVSDYLLANAADRNGGRLGRKIMKHSPGQAPERISTLPYIQRKHRKIDPAVFERPAVGGLRNCAACHAGAEQGDFDDDRASIPR